MWNRDGRTARISARKWPENNFLFKIIFRNIDRSHSPGECGDGKCRVMCDKITQNVLRNIRWRTGENLNRRYGFSREHRLQKRFVKRLRKNKEYNESKYRAVHNIMMIIDDKRGAVYTTYSFAFICALHGLRSPDRQSDFGFFKSSKDDKYELKKLSNRYIFGQIVNVLYFQFFCFFSYKNLQVLT